jgi:hypothetical protein
MANEFKFDSELGLQSPADKQTPLMQQQSGVGGGGLADFLNQLTEGLRLSGAYYQAGQGNVAPLQMLQEQKQKQTLLNQLQSFAQQPEMASFQPQIQQRLALGDVEGAAKLADQAPKLKGFTKTVMNNKLLTEEEKAGIIYEAENTGLSQGLLSYNNALKEVRKQGAEARAEQNRMNAEMRKQQAADERRLNARNPSNILKQALKDSVLTDKSTLEEIRGVLQAKGAVLPVDEDKRQEKIKEILTDPELKKIFPNAKELSWWDRLFAPSVPAAAPSQQQAAPAKPAPKVGTIVKGYKFKGGDPANKKNWEKQ